MAEILEKVRAADRGHLEADCLVGEVHQKSVRGGIVTIAAQAMKFLLQIGSTMAFSRLLTPQQIGLVAMVTAVTGFVAMFKDCGLSMATVQRKEITHAQVSNLFWINCALSAGVMVVAALLAPAIAAFNHEPRLIGITLALSLSFLFSGLTVQHQAILRRQMRFADLAAIEVSSSLFGLLVGLGMAFAGWGYWSLVGTTFASAVANCAGVWARCRWRPSRYQARVGARSMIAFGGSLTLFDTLNYFSRNFDNILIGRVLGASALGFYSKAYGLLTLPMNQINAPVTGVVLPALSRLQHRPEDFAGFYLKALRALSFFSVPLVVFSFVLAEETILVLLGRQWLPAVRIFQLLAPAALMGAINVAPGWLCISLGRPQLQVHYTLVSAPACILAFLIGVRWGTAGVALAFSMVFVSAFWAFVWYACRQSPVKCSQVAKTFLAALIPACLAGAVVWGVRRGLPESSVPLARLLICFVVFSLIYGVLSLVSKESRAFIWRMAIGLRQALDPLGKRAG